LKRCSVFTKLRGHFIEGRSQACNLSGALHGNARAQPPGGESLGSQSQSVDRSHDEIGQQDIGQQQHRRCGQAEVEEKQTSPCRIAAITRRYPHAQLQTVRYRLDRVGIAFQNAPASMEPVRSTDLDALDEALLDHLRDRPFAQPFPVGTRPRRERLRKAERARPLLFGALTLVEPRRHEAQ